MIWGIVSGKFILFNEILLVKKDQITGMITINNRYWNWIIVLKVYKQNIQEDNGLSNLKTTAPWFACAHYMLDLKPII